MNKYDLIAFDMDGTLLDSSQSITAASQEAIARADAAGKTIILSTGRSPSELKMYQNELKHVRYYICESGALLLDTFENRILSTTQIPDKTIRRIFDLTSNQRVMYHILTEGEVMISSHGAAHLSDYGMSAFKEFMLRVCKIIDNPVASYLNHPYPIEKLNLFCATPEIRESLIQTFSKLNLPVEMAREAVSSLEVSPKGVSKGAGLITLCKYLSVPVERTIAVGDSYNDATILETAGLAIAMGNARSELKETSDVVVADNDHDGCAEAIYKYLLADYPDYE